MKDFTQKYKSICVFPEGMFSYPGTLTRFRSGAFQIGEPICPIILKYDKCILDADFINFALKIGSGVKETVEVIFLDPIYPPFNEETPELVRKMMSKTGLLLSRVCANDYSNK
jgi:1-acyl-sn-glycerol-3-phosphate acyltransferase